MYKRKNISQFNRYTDILTYANTRVELKGQNFETDYINACYVDSPFGHD